MKKPPTPRTPKRLPRPFGGAGSSGTKKVPPRMGDAHVRTHQQDSAASPVSVSGPSKGRPNAASKGRSGGRGISKSQEQALAAARAKLAPQQNAQHQRKVTANRSLPIRDGQTHEQIAADFADRLAAQRKSRRSFFLRRTVSVVFGVVLVSLTVWAVFFSPLFALSGTKISVLGAANDTQQKEIEMLVRARWGGTPITRIGLGAVRQAVSGVHKVETAQVSRNWPDGLEVRVTQREPVAVAKSGAGFVLLDSDGVKLDTVASAPAGFPRVTVPLDGDKTRPALRAVLSVLGDIPKDLRAGVVHAGANDSQTVTFTLKAGGNVNWGAPKDNAFKAKVLVLLLKDGGSFFDVSDPLKPTVRQ